MTVGQKASVSLLIAVLLFAAFAVAAFSGLFDVIESNFRNPALVRGITGSLAKVAEAEAGYHAANLARFGSILAQDSLRRSFLPNLSSQDAFDRANLLGKLQEETAGLAGIRLIDANGKRLHFSTIPGDIRSKTQLETVYRNFGEAGDPPYESLSAPEGSKGLVRFDAAASRFVYSLPFADSYGIYRGSAVFQVSMDALVSLLVKEGLAPVGESATTAGEGGILLRVPLALRSVLPARVAELWSSGLGADPLPIAASNGTGESFVLFSSRVEGAGRVGYVVSSGDFALPTAMKWILLSTFFVTAYLLAFLILNIRQDRMTVLSDRIKRFQINLLEEYVENKSDLDFGRWSRELEARRPEVRKAIRASVGRLRKNRRADVDELIDKSWDEILSVLGGRASGAAVGTPGLKEIERLLGEALKSGSFVLPAGSVVARAEPQPVAREVPKPPSQAPSAPPASEEAVEELGEFEETEELEEAEEIGEAEELEEVEEIGKAEEAEEAEEIGEAGELEELEELEEAEAPLADGEQVQSISLRSPTPQAEAGEVEVPAIILWSPRTGQPEGYEPSQPEGYEPSQPALQDRKGLQPVSVRYALAESETEAVSKEPESQPAREGEPEELEELEELEEAEELAEPQSSEPELAGAVSPESPIPPAASQPEELEELEALEEGELEGAVSPAALSSRAEEAAFDERSTSTKAYELASAEYDDIPVIPESSGLELADEGDISDIIGFIDLDDAGRAEELELLEAEEEENDSIARLAEDYARLEELESFEPLDLPEAPLAESELVQPTSLRSPAPEEPEAPLAESELVQPTSLRSPAPEEPVELASSSLAAPEPKPELEPEIGPEPEARSDDSGLEPLEEVEFELLLSSIDLSSLEQWDRGPAGAAEADATRFDAGDESLIPLELEFTARTAPEAPVAEEAEEPEELEELEELEEPEELEELGPEPAVATEAAPTPAAATDDGTAVELGRYLGPCIRYRPFAPLERAPAFEELPVVGEGEPWAEVEFIGEDDEDDEQFAADNGIIEYRDGVFRLKSESALAGPALSPGSAEDPELRALVDSVLRPEAKG